MLGVTPKSTVISAITQRGGFTESSYRQRVLVIRSSLQNPERIVVDTAAVLTGREPDPPLLPKDIVYVSSRPWRYAEHLADSAVETFRQSMTASWTSRNIGPLIEKYVLPQIKDESEVTP
ncbi:MAG: hypothetical protein J6386_14460 [Candidatus Synoicihabitans palmerolidicus]|nr:hypothetical protein [Candidatus Synoicihabitans palmerolidicus]